MIFQKNKKNIKPEKLAKIMDNEASRIIDENLRLMESVELGGLQNLLCKESVGSNAGKWKDMLCVCARFFYDSNGEIKYFGNWQNVPKDVREKFCEGFFMIATKIFNGIILNKIIEIAYFRETCIAAKENIKESARIYNNMYFPNDV